MKQTAPTSTKRVPTISQLRMAIDRLADLYSIVAGVGKEVTIWVYAGDTSQYQHVITAHDLARLERDAARSAKQAAYLRMLDRREQQQKRVNALTMHAVHRASSK